MQTVFVQMQFYFLLLFSLIVPVAIYVGLLWRRVISRNTVLIFGVALLLISGVDIYLLQVLASMAKTTSSHWDNTVFLSELSLALYLLPLTYGGIGVNLISHVLIRHLSHAERRFEQNPHTPEEGGRRRGQLLAMDSVQRQTCLRRSLQAACVEIVSVF